jgi:ribosome-binding protein aMBF1 (putative translation factor)
MSLARTSASPRSEYDLAFLASRRAIPRLRTAFGRRVRELRRRRGWSQAVLAAKAGFSGKFLGEVERGEKSISLDNLAYLARAVRVPMTELLE